MDTVLRYLRTAHPDAVVDAMGGGPADWMRARYGIDSTPLYWYMKYEGRSSGPSAIALKAVGKGLDAFRTMSWVRRHDVVIVPGAGPLETTLPVRAWGFPLTLFQVALSGRLSGTKVALVSVGADAIKKRATRRLSNATARLAYYRSYRDAYSLEAMRRRGIDTTRDRVYPDLGFGAPTPVYEPGDVNIVGVGVMAYYGGNDDRQRAAQIHSRYAEKMTEFVGWLLSGGHQVRLFGGDSKFDWDVARQIMTDVRRGLPDLDPAALTVERADSYAELMRVMAPVGTVIATRYHNVMCALKLCKPTISLGYSRKFAVLMDGMGLGEFNQSAESFDVAQLIEQFKAVNTRHTELQQLMADRNAANRRALDDQFAILSKVLFDADKGAVPRKAPAPTSSLRDSGYDQLGAGERLSIARAALYAAQAGQAKESLFAPPVAFALRGVALVEQLDLLARDLAGQREVCVRPGQVAVPLGDLVGEVELVAEGRRCYFTDNPVVLVRIAWGRAENEVRFAGSCHALDDLLDLLPDGRQASFRQVVEFDLEVSVRRETPHRPPGLLLPLRRSGQQNVPQPEPRVAPGEAEQHAAGRDLDVVWVRADREQRHRLPGGLGQLQADHTGTALPSTAAPPPDMTAADIASACPERSGSQTIHGQYPRWYISSIWARSLTVSAGDQYPLYG
jgi:polysaccharide pyruvyl transferase WcaK-like protein